MNQIFHLFKFCIYAVQLLQGGPDKKYFCSWCKQGFTRKYLIQSTNNRKVDIINQIRRQIWHGEAHKKAHRGQTLPVWYLWKEICAGNSSPHKHIRCKHHYDNYRLGHWLCIWGVTQGRCLTNALWVGSEQKLHFLSSILYFPAVGLWEGICSERAP